MENISNILNKEFIGQESLIEGLSNYFINKINNDNKGIILILGEKDTGKKTLVKEIFKLLKEDGKVKSSEIDVIDVASYNFNFGINAFLTDLYKVLNNNSEGIIFKNIKKGKKEVLEILSNIHPNTCLNLLENYKMKNEILVEREEGEKSELDKLICHNKFFIFVSDDENLNIDEFLGKDFSKRIDKVFRSKKLSLNERYLVIRKILATVVEDIEDTYGADVWINLNENMDEDKYNLCKFIYDSFKSDEELDIKRYIDYKLSKPVKNLINIGTINPKNRIMIYRKEEYIYCSDGNGEYKLNEFSDTTLEEAKYKLNSITGVKELKDFIENIENNVKVQKIRKKMGLKVTSPSLNMIFAGNAGTGKTNAARITFEYLNALGLLSKGIFKEVSKSDFVAENINDVAKTTIDVINSAIGGVLFIDEAYSLCEGESDKVGKEIVDALLKGIEDNRENLVVIMAGYEKDMDKFLSINQGLKSRFPNTIHFYDYTPEEMYEIAINIAKSKGYRINPEIKNDLIELFYKNQIGGKNDLGNARFVRNIVENAILDASKKYISGVEKALDILDFENFNFKIKTKFNLEEKLKGIIGLDSVKDLLRNQYKLIIAQEKRKSVGIHTEIDQNLNMVFAGNPGTGKTSIARLVAEMLNSIGLLKTGQLIETDRSSFVTGEKGSTAKRTEEVFKKAIGGVLFIDEAYTLANDELGIEAIETLLKLIEDYGNEVVVILAGYEKELEDFFDVNIGLKSRFPVWTTFEDYKPEELLDMAIKIIENKGFKLSKNGYTALKKSFENIYEESDAQSGNGRMVRNYVENLIRIESIRIAETDVSTNDMNLITAKDIESSNYSTRNKIDINDLSEKIIGREKEKRVFKNIESLIRLKEVRRRKGIESIVSKNLNILISGNEGTGKKLFAEILSEELYYLGITKTKGMVKVKGIELIKDLKEKGIDGILNKSIGKTVYLYDLASLIEEDVKGYYMSEIISFMEKNNGKIVIILSGYEKEIRELLYRNIKLGGSFIEYIKLNDYSTDEIEKIIINKLSHRGFNIESDEKILIEDTIKEIYEDENINVKNGILVKNFIDCLTKIQGYRVGSEKLSIYLNSKIEKIDILECKECFKEKYKKPMEEKKEENMDLEKLLKLKELLDLELITKEEFMKLK
ncbi:MAG: AAA family ATPase [Clostridium sp.]|uniref:AAA family ATPase n=1 Tax=Clostridium sp. TaxID=1506 RepID=UPI003EE5EC82